MLLTNYYHSTVFSLEHLIYCYINVHKNWNTNIYFCFRKNDYVNIYLSKWESTVTREPTKLTLNS